MKNILKNGLILLMLIGLVTLSSFSIRKRENTTHQLVTKTTEKNKDGKEVIKTEIIFDKSTSREDVIAACSSLANENVQLTFEKLTIWKSLLGILGNSRIAYAKGQLQLPNGLSKNFEAGGVLNFRSIKII